MRMEDYGSSCAKQHGAQSAVNYFEEKQANVERVARDKGYWIMKITKTR